MTESRKELIDFFSLTREELRTLLVNDFSMPAFAAQQIFDWVYKKQVIDFSAMTNLANTIRPILKENFNFPLAQIKQRQISNDGTRKYVFEVSPGVEVESVMIKQPDRMTLCVSSQVGCGMGCTFCRTATMGFQKNLKAGDIVRQVLAVREDALNFGDDFSNIVFMGMGEPLHNFPAVTRAIKILQDDLGIGLGPRKITVSTVGLVPAIKKFMDLQTGANLAVSLNATTDEVRSQIMPVNTRYPLKELLSTLEAVPLGKRKKITIEYVMLSDLNDREEDLKRLPKILSGVRCKINLIPYNENAGLGFKSPPDARVHKWYRVLNDAGMPTTIRWSKGKDIDAACGQLRTSPEQQKNEGSTLLAAC